MVAVYGYNDNLKEFTLVGKYAPDDLKVVGRIESRQPALKG